MLRIRAPRIRLALSRAARAKQRSFECTPASEAHRFWLKMEEKWLLLAESYAQVERTTTFLQLSNGFETEAGAMMTDPKEFRPPGPLGMLSDREREMAERHLVQAEEAVVAGEGHIERQKEIIREMESKGQDLVLAKQLLHTFLALQQEHLAHRDRLKTELGLYR